MQRCDVIPEDEEVVGDVQQLMLQPGVDGCDGGVDDVNLGEENLVDEQRDGVAVVPGHFRGVEGVP